MDVYTCAKNRGTPIAIDWPHILQQPSYILFDIFRQTYDDFHQQMQQVADKEGFTKVSVQDSWREV